MANLGTWRNVEANIVQQPIAETSTTRLHKLREEIRAKDTGSNALGEATFVYAQGLASTAVGDIVAIEDDGTTTRVVAGGVYKLIGIAMSANVASQYGWYLIIGKENGNVGTSFADNAACYLSATAGRIDDAAVEGDFIFGMKGAGAESSNLAALELNRANTTAGVDNNLMDTLTLSGDLTMGSAVISETDIAKIDGITNGTQAAGKAVVADANVNTGVSKVTELHIGASGSEVKLDATPLEVNSQCDDSLNEESITGAGALSVTKRNSILNLSGAGAVTLAACPASMIGKLKTIEMETDNGDVTLSLANVQGGTAGTTATWDDIAEQLVLIGAKNGKWTVVKEFGVTLS